MIEARNVSVAIGRKQIISNVDFGVRPGEVAAIVGPNGSGKTSFLKAASGDLPFTGSIAINGRDITTMNAWEAASLRAVLPQATALSFPFTVREVVSLGATGGRTGALTGQEARLPERALARVDLEGFAGRFYQELSGGEQQRVQLARVLCQVWSPFLGGSARYLFLDEPVSSLDIKHQLLIMNIARDFSRRGGGVIAILHDLNLAAMFADRVFLMHGGQVAAAGSPGEVLTDALISDVFECPLKVNALPAHDTPFILPQAAEGQNRPAPRPMATTPMDRPKQPRRGIWRRYHETQ